MNKFVYILGALIAIAISVPAAIATSQFEDGDIFVECFENCGSAPSYAALDTQGK